MYSFLRSLTLRRGLAVEAPVFLTAFLIAEFFYKFHSFTLECLAFLATWYVLSAFVMWAVGEVRHRAPSDPRGQA